MFIPENYVLSNEIADQGGIHIANISNFIKLVTKEGIPDTIIKYGNCTFLNKKSPYLPKTFMKIIFDKNNKITDMSNKLLSSYIQTEFNCTKKEFINGTNSKEVKVAGKSFIEIQDNILSIKDKVITNINKEDYEDCLACDDIQGGFKLSKNNYLVWY